MYSIKRLRDSAHIADAGHSSEPQPHFEVSGVWKLGTISADRPLDVSTYHYLG
jgi:hypothetical protein